MGVIIKNDVPINNISDYIDYNPETGKVINKRFKSGKFCISNGYYVVMINKTMYRLHRLIWYMYYGEFPKQYIDHINGNRLDNRICNLRDVSHLENLNNPNNRNKNRPKQQKKKVPNKGFAKVYYAKGIVKYKVFVTKNKKRVYIGTFDTEEEAQNIYLSNK